MSLKQIIPGTKAWHIRHEKCVATGARVNMPDRRDYIFKSRTTSEPSINLRHLLPSDKSWLYQGNLGSCVAHAIAFQVRASDALQENTPSNLLAISRLYLYYYARWCESRKEPTGEGAYPRLAYKVLQRVGCPQERVWPYSTKRSKVNKKPSYKARKAAYRRDTFEYTWISGGYDRRLADIKRALSEERTVTFSTPVSQAMHDYVSGSGDVLCKPHAYSGRHALCIYGYDTDGNFLVANSWRGREHLIMAPDYIGWSKSTDFGVLI